MAIHLGRMSPCASRDQPGRRAGNTPRPPKHGERAVPIRSCSGWGLPCRRCRQRRGALLPHPFTLAPPAPFARNRAPESRAPENRARLMWRKVRSGLLSVALSLRFAGSVKEPAPSPGVTRHPVSVEPGLSSRAARKQAAPAAIRPTGSFICKPCARAHQACRAPPRPCAAPAHPPRHPRAWA